MPKKESLLPPPGYYYQGHEPRQEEHIGRDVYYFVGVMRVPMIQQTYAVLEPISEIRETLPYHFEAVTVWAFTEQTGLNAFKMVTDPTLLSRLQAIRDAKYGTAVPDT